jgi:nucleoside-diphosphate-sugar epimerase
MKTDSRKKVAFLLGGTGFIGSAVLQKLLAHGRTVLTTTRCLNRNGFIARLERRGVNVNMVCACLERRQLRVLYNFDLGHPALAQVSPWYHGLRDVGLTRKDIGVVINLVTDTSASNRDILTANLPRTVHLVNFVKTLRASGCAELIYISMGSVAEKANVLRSPYARAKRKVRKLLSREQASDFHVIAGLVKGRGDHNLPKAASYLVDTMSGFPLWHDSFKLSVISVEDLADILLLLETSSRLLKARASCDGKMELPLEVNVSGGELTFKEVLENLVDEERAKQLRRPAALSFGLEALYLAAYWIINRTFFSSNQVRVRLANFALLGALARWPALQRRINHHLTVGMADEIRAMVDAPVSVEIPLDRDLLCVLRREPARLFILRPREVGELKGIVRQGRLRDVNEELTTAALIETEVCRMTSAVR